MNTELTKISVKQAAAIMGVSRRRVNKMINDNCPECGGTACEVCFGTGRRLPAVRLNADNSGPWQVIRDGLELDHNRRRHVGRSYAESEGE